MMMSTGKVSVGACLYDEECSELGVGDALASSIAVFDLKTQSLHFETAVLPGMSKSESKFLVR